MTSTRVLVAARLSIAGDRDEESRISRDELDARAWADGQGHEVVGVSRDRGVSGSVSPFKRPALGRWLADPDTFDVIVASSIDRLGRSARDLESLQTWAEEHGKRIVVLRPDLEWPLPSPTSPQRFMWSLLADLAEIERETIKERIAGGVGTARTNGAFVGKPTFGFEVVGEKYHRTLRPKPALVPVLRELVDRALAGEGFRSLARWLDTTGHRSPSAGRTVKGKGGTTTASELWSPTSVAQILRSPDLKGRRTEGGRTYKFESLLSVAEWNTLQAALPQGQRGPNSSATPLLTGILRCGKCDGPMYRIATTSKTRAGQFNYRCKGTDQVPSTCANSVPLDDIEAWTDQWFTEDGPFARTEIVEQVVVPGADHLDEIAEIETEMREAVIDHPERVEALRTERARLQALPNDPSQVTEVATGRTVSEVWSTLDDEARRSYLLAAGVQVHVISSAALRAQPGAENRWITGDPHRVIGTVRGITEAESDAAVG